VHQTGLDVADTQPGHGVLLAIDPGQTHGSAAGVGQHPVAFENHGGDVLLGRPTESVCRDLRGVGSLSTVAARSACCSANATTARSPRTFSPGIGMFAMSHSNEAFVVVIACALIARFR
jgi:hypothetical protein